MSPAFLFEPVLPPSLPDLAASAAALVLLFALLCAGMIALVRRTRLPEYLFPLRGRWLRYLLVPLFVAGLVAGFVALIGDPGNYGAQVIRVALPWGEGEYFRP